jgi:hypothetical protein
VSEGHASNTKAAAVALLRKGVEIAKRDYEADPSESLLIGQKWQRLSRTADAEVFRLTDSSLDARALAIGAAVGDARKSGGNGFR